MQGADQDIKPNQDRRLKPPMQGENQQQQQQQQSPQQQPQKCPRCESLNTKFCYYNNYSLSQPRYFCKTCRRYWTQGGTLRNVPVGGGCRKGKRTKTSSSSTSSSGEISSRSHNQPQQQNLMTTTPQTIKDSSGNLATASGISYYSGGGFLSSLAAIQSLNQQQSFNQHLNQNQPLNVGVGGVVGGVGGVVGGVGDLGGGSSSNLGMLQGFNVASFGSQQHQGQFYQMGGGGRDNKSVNLMYPSQSSRPASSSDWHQNFINTTHNPTVSDAAAMWSINTSTTSGNTNNNNNNHNNNTTGDGSSSLNPNQWPDLPGYGPPP